MLHHEEPNEHRAETDPVPGVPAAQVRVTAEEFARAVTRYQSKREAAARRMEGTVSIGDAVRELDLEATPEEILAEVEAERVYPRSPVSQTRSRMSPLQAAWAGAAAGFSVMVLLSGAIWAFRSADSREATQQAIIATTPTPPQGETIDAPGTTLVQDTSGKGPPLKTLAEVPDGVPVRCALTQTNGQAAFTPFANPGSAWTLIKHGGHLYVRGWIANMSRRAIETNGVTLYNQKAVSASADAPPVPATFAVDGLRALPGQGDDEMIVAQNVRLDAHFQERW